MPEELSVTVNTCDYGGKSSLKKETNGKTMDKAVTAQRRDPSFFQAKLVMV